MTAPLTDRDILNARTNKKIGTHLVLETQTMRIWHLRIGPGETLAAHHHDRPYFWTVLTDGKGQVRFGDGRIVDITYHAGDTKDFSGLTPKNDFVHDLTNTGEDELIFVTVEFNC